MLDFAANEIIFLSSLCSEVMDLRRNIYDAVNSNVTLPHLYADEIDNPRSETEMNDHFFVVNDLVKKLSNSKLVIVLVSNILDRSFDHGSLITNSEVSFWEIELYHAAILKIPTYVIVEKGIDIFKRPLLGTVLQILPSVSKNIIVEDRNKITQRVLDIIEMKEHKNDFILEKYLIRLKQLRAASFDIQYNIFDKNASSLQFKNIEFVNNSLNESLVKNILADVQKETNFQKRVSLLYVAFKELLKEPYWINQDPVILSYWAHVSFLLSEDLRWYGVHGHMNMGVIHHTGDYGVVQSILSNQNKRNVIELPYSHYTAFASEYYSLYKYFHQDNLKKAFTNIELGLAANFGLKDRTSLIHIRGSCYLTARNLGKAIKDFETCIQELENMNADATDIGHSYTKLGISYFVSFRFKKGFDFIKKGIDMMPNDSANKIRSLRILEYMYTWSFQRRKAREVQNQALEVAIRMGALDQVKKITENIR